MTATRPPSDAELLGALRRILGEAGTAAPRLIRRRASEYRTSFPLEELELTLEDGAELRLAFKRLDREALDGLARLAKPEFLHDPRREAAVYASVLAPAAVAPAPHCYGAAIDPAAGRYWLFVEWVEGRELHQVGDRRLWEAAAGRLAEMHAGLAQDLDRHAERGRLLDYDAPYYRRWIDRAREFARTSGQAARRRSLDWVGERYGPVVECLLDLPKTVIHGEFYASNVLVGGDLPSPRVAAVDWELAASGPALVDLAALVSGGWAEGDRRAIASAYRAVAGPAVFRDRALDFARLHLAVQWLGWAPPAWVPPPGQRHDWLGEAVALAEGLGL